MASRGAASVAVFVGVCMAMAAGCGSGRSGQSRMHVSIHINVREATGASPGLAIGVRGGPLLEPDRLWIIARSEKTVDGRAYSGWDLRENADGPTIVSVLLPEDALDGDRHPVVVYCYREFDVQIIDEEGAAGVVKEAIGLPPGEHTLLIEGR